MAEEQTQQEPGKGSAGTLIVRIVLIVILVFVVIFAVRWYGVKGKYDQAVDLYEQHKFSEAHDLFEEVIASPVSAFRLRGKAQESLARCKSEMASELAMSQDRTAETLDEALTLLEEAKDLAGGSEEIERRIQEYTQMRDRLKENQAAPDGARIQERPDEETPDAPPPPPLPVE